jgi:hypothetical protein
MELRMPTLDWMQANITWGWYLFWIILIPALINTTTWFKKEKCERIKKCVNCRGKECRY